MIIGRIMFESFFNKVTGFLAFLTHPYPSQKGILGLVYSKTLISQLNSQVKGTKTPLLGGAGGGFLLHAHLSY
jgi:hypothetical protein